MPEILLADKVTFCRLNRGVTEQELNLLKLTATSVTQLCAGSSQIVWGDMVQARFFAAIPYHVPHHVLGDTPAPHFASLADGTKYPPVRDLRSRGPQIERLFGPLRNRHGANVPALADQIHDRPVALAGLDLVSLQAGQF